MIIVSDTIEYSRDNTSIIMSLMWNYGKIIALRGREQHIFISGVSDEVIGLNWLFYVK